MLAVWLVFSLPEKAAAQTGSTLDITRLVIAGNGHVKVDFELRMQASVANGRISVFRNIPGTIFYGEVWRNDLHLPQVFQGSITDNGANANLRSEAYFVVAFDQEGRTIAASTAHRTLYLRSVLPDLCNHTFILTWENYQITTSDGVPVLLPVPFQIVESQISSDGLQFTTIAQFAHPAPGTPPQQSLTAALQPGRYFFRIKASAPATGQLSYSNVQVVDFSPPVLEAFSIDFVNVYQNREIRASFSASGNWDRFRYSVWRSAGNESPFVQIANMVQPGEFADTPDLTAGPWVYKVNAHHLNIVCPNPAYTTTLASSLFLEVESGQGKNEVNLKWQHLPAGEKRHQYFLFQQVHGIWNEIARISDYQARSHSFFPDRSQLGFEWVFKAEAREVSGQAEPITSNYATLAATPSVFLPNAFRPNSQILENRVFLPLFVGFVPVDYQLVIFDRQGHLLFSTTNPTQGWDGSKPGGVAPAGVYSFLLRYRDPTGAPRQEQGVVALVE